MFVIGSLERVVPTTAGCAIAGAGGGGPVIHDVLDPDRVKSERSTTVFSGCWDAGSTGVTLGVGSGLLVKCISRRCCERIRRPTLLRVPQLLQVLPRPLQCRQW